MKCPECGKFMAPATKQVWAMREGQKVTFTLHGVSCGCGYKAMQNYETTVRAYGLEPYTPEEAG